MRKHSGYREGYEHDRYEPSWTARVPLTILPVLSLSRLYIDGHCAGQQHHHPIALLNRVQALHARGDPDIPHCSVGSIECDDAPPILNIGDRGGNLYRVQLGLTLWRRLDPSLLRNSWRIHI